ncbi:MAG: aldehyde dehydrogenase family protein [Dehalococcoidia bacterium]
MQDYKMWIGGKWVNAESGKTYTAVNPATGEEIARIPLGGKADVDKAVAAAQKAFPLWSKKPQAERSRIIGELAGHFMKHAQEFVSIDILDHGTPVKISNMFTMGLPGDLEYASQVSRSFMGKTIPVDASNLIYLQREPMGVCALIIPWNVPLLGIVKKLAAALSVGNVCIVKPPSVDSLTALKLGEVLEEAGIPEGIVNIVTGSGSTAGAALAAHPGVDMISFTGSCESGKDIMAVASRTMKKVFLELGGKNPFFVLEDANVDAALGNALFAAFFNTGMVCAAPGRFYIQEKIYDEFVEKFVAGAKNVVVGDPNDEKTDMGPVVSAEHRDKVEGYIKIGIEEGAKLALGGKRPTQPPLDKGFYIMPTVFTDVTQDMRIAREEIFGPVAVFLKFKSGDEVPALANDSNFGLCASIWTADTCKAVTYANDMRTGTVWINNHLLFGSELPWGGYKESGCGKENGVLGLEEYTQVKLISLALPGEMPGPQ